jgi:cytochrome c
VQNLTELTQINTTERRSNYLSKALSKGAVGMTRHFLYQVAIAAILITPAAAASPAEQRGKAFALTNCAKCHSVDRVTQSPLKIAPPFRTLHERYRIETLAEAFAEGIYTGHPTMPAFQLEADQINDLLAYLKTLE